MFELCNKHSWVAKHRFSLLRRYGLCSTNGLSVELKISEAKLPTAAKPQKIQCFGGVYKQYASNTLLDVNDITVCDKLLIFG